MSLRDCLTRCGLTTSLQPGLQALGNYSKRITLGSGAKATGSVDLDAALRAAQPTASRWDYGISLEASAAVSIAWVEVHPAMSSEVEAVLKKLTWLKQWQREAGGACQRAPSSYHWVATDAVHIDATRRRRLAAQGLKMPQRQIRLP